MEGMVNGFPYMGVVDPIGWVKFPSGQFIPNPSEPEGEKCGPDRPVESKHRRHIPIIQYQSSSS